MVVWSLLVLGMAILADAAVPDPPDPASSNAGSLKLASETDCTSGVVAFSAIQGSVDTAKVVLAERLVDIGVGYAAQTGTITIHCPGLYQFSFAGYGSTDLRLTLKRKTRKNDSWRPIVSVGPGGGSNLVLLDVDVGDQLAVFVERGKLADGATLSAYRIAERPKRTRRYDW